MSMFTVSQPSVLQQHSPMTYEKLLHEQHGQLGLQPPLNASPDSGADGLPSVLMIAGVHPMALA